MFTRVNSNRSPSRPLSPLDEKCASEKKSVASPLTSHFSPAHALRLPSNKLAGKIRRSFTPLYSNNIISPLSVSPIKMGNGPNVMKSVDSTFSSYVTESVKFKNAEKENKMVNAPLTKYNTPHSNIKPTVNASFTQTISDRTPPCYIKRTRPLNQTFSLEKSTKHILNHKEEYKVNKNVVRRSLCAFFNSPQGMNTGSDDESQQRTSISPVSISPNSMHVQPNDQAIQSSDSDKNVTTQVLVYSPDENGNVIDSPALTLDEIVAAASIDKNNSFLNEKIGIECILKEIGLEKYIEKFHYEEIDLFVFFLLTAEDLVELEIEKKDAEVLLNAIDMYAETFGEAKLSLF